MAGFKMHITTSSIVGVGYATTAATVYQVPLESCVLAGGLCSVSGMMPDLDSDSGVPIRESMAFAAAVVPMMVLSRFEQLHFSPESCILIGGLIYLIIRFGFARFLKKYTVHRGMFHSIPAALIAAELAFLLSNWGDVGTRFFMAGAVLLGFLSHLFLDELYSIEWRRGRMRLKKSFGTALKLWSSNSMWANFSTYAKLAALTFLALNDPTVADSLNLDTSNLNRLAETLRETILK